MNFGQAYKKYPFVRQSRTRAGFGQPNEIHNFNLFVKYLKNNFPKVYRKIKAINPVLLTYQGKISNSDLNEAPRIYSYEFGDASPIMPTANTSWTDKLLQIGQGALTVWQQQKLFDLQVKRAERGLAPLDVRPTAIPIAVQTSPDVEKQISSGVKTASNMIAIGVPVVAAIFVLRKLRII